MPGTLLFAVPKKCKNDQALAERLLDRVRTQAELVGVKVPKRTSFGGSYGDYFRMSYTTNKMRDLLIAEARKMRIKPFRRMDGTSTHSYRKPATSFDVAFGRWI